MFIRDFIDILAFHVHIHGTLAALSSHARHSLHLGIAVIILICMGLIHKQVIHAQFLKGNRSVFLPCIIEPVKTVL